MRRLKVLDRAALGLSAMGRQNSRSKMIAPDLTPDREMVSV